MSFLVNPLPDDKILDSSKLKAFADDNFKFGLLRAIFPFPTVFSKGLLPRGVKRCHCVGMG